MYSAEQRKRALDLLAEYGYSYCRVIRELGYPNRNSLRNWRRQLEETGDAGGRRKRGAAYSEEQRRRAVDRCLRGGMSAAAAARELGYPATGGTLLGWVRELEPGARPRRPLPSPGERAAGAAALAARSGTAREAAAGLGVSVSSLYNWRKEVLGGGEAGMKESKPDREPGAARGAEALAGLEAEAAALRAEAAELRAEVRSLRLQRAVLEGALEMAKKGPGADPNRLTNREKAALVNALRGGEWGLGELLAAVGMAKSSYEYAARALERGGGRRDAARRAVAEAFGAGAGRYGYRRVLGEIRRSGGPAVGEWTVRAIMREEGLAAKAPRRRRRYSSYEGETSAAPANLLRRPDGTHDFRAAAPNRAWVTDVTEFSIPAGKVYLSPVVDCFDGMPLSWSISASPNAEMANSSLLGACAWLAEGDRPVVHSDRGCHYRWPGWAAICAERGLRRSMSRKGCSPDNARAEGFFGRLKVEFFHGEDWEGVSVERFSEMLDGYLRWYRDERLKSDLGYRSPMQYRRDLGLVGA